MKYYLFEDQYTSEPFIVAAECEQDALNEALGYFADPYFIKQVSEGWVDGHGFDVY